jgi:hypothetical protein
MNITTLLNAIRDAVAADTALADWADQTYGVSSVTVRKGVNLQDPPTVANCPMVVLYPLSKTVGQRRAQKEHVIHVECCVHDDGATVTGNVTEYDGLDRLEALRKQVEDIIAAVDIGNLEIASIDIEYEAIEFFPFISAVMAITMTETNTLGCDPFE